VGVPDRVDNAVMTSISRRYSPGARGSRSALIAFANTLRPSVRTNRETRPGENPPACTTSLATAAPSAASAAARTRAGRSTRRSRVDPTRCRAPDAAIGAVDPERLQTSHREHAHHHRADSAALRSPRGGH
jgi:hypothetical protein